MIKNNRLKELRKSSATNKSQISFHKNILVDKLGIDVSLRTLQNWEAGSSSIKNEYAKKISDYFDVSIAYLLGYSDNKKDSDNDSFERISLNNNPVSDWDFNYGLQEFQAIGGSRNELYEEVLEEFKQRSKYDKRIVNPEKHAQKWIRVFMASFGMAPPPTQVIIARYYTVPKKDRKSIDILLETLSGFEIKEAEKILEDSKGLLTFIEEDL